MGWSNICARSTCWPRTAGRARRCVPHGGHQFALNIAVGLGLGGNEIYPQVFAPFGGFADNCRGQGQPRRHAGRAGRRLRGEE